MFGRQSTYCVSVRPQILGYRPRAVTSALDDVGWGDRWVALLAEHGPDAEPGRVLRHDGVAVQVRTPSGDRTVKLRRGVEPITVGDWLRSEEHTSELQSLMRISYAVFCLKKKKTQR